MGDLKKVLTVVVCGCMCLMGATSARGQVGGATTDNKGDELTAACRAANGLSVCNVFVTLANVGDRVFAVEADVFQVLTRFGNLPAPLFQVGPPFAGDTAPSSAFIMFDPNLPCDSFVTIGLKDSVAGDETRLGACLDPADCAWDSVAFNSIGLTDGYWFLFDQTGGQGDAGDDKQVLIMQASYLLGRRMEGTALVSWVALGGDGSNGTTTVTFECMSECPDGGHCTDSNPCTMADTCIEGVCIGEDIICPENPDPCLATKCVDGMCVDNPVGEGDFCDDGNPCTSGETCQGGQCAGGTPECTGFEDCADGNPCTDNSCDANGCCVTSNNNNACDDGNACTENDTCMGGCVGGEPVNCDDGNACTDDFCDPASGCMHIPNDGPCDDGNPCTAGDHCLDGMLCSGVPECTSDDVCDDGNPCTDNTCDANGCCVTTNNTDPCDDGDACTENDICSGGSCGGSDVNCNDSNDCTDDGCDSATGCTHTPNNGPCDDGNACTTDDTCDGGCVGGGPPPNCDDGNECTDDFCDPASGCMHIPNNNACDDGDNCTVNDMCMGGCVGGEPVECPEGEVCDPETGDCVAAPSGFLDILYGHCPNILRRNGLGWLRMALLGSDDPDAIDPCDIDPASIRLSRVGGTGATVEARQHPAPKCRDRGTPFLAELCDCHARRKDGIPDLDMRFKLQEVVNVLGLGNPTEFPAGTSVRLRLEAQAFDGRTIRAEDCVILGRDLGPNP